MLSRYAFVGVFLLAFSEAVLACSCARASVEDHYQSADAVLVAEALDITNEPNSEVHDGRQYQLHLQTVRWRASFIWKGAIEIDRVFTTRTRVWNGSCGVSVTPGSSMLLFLDDDVSNPSVNMCRGNRSLSEAVWLIPAIFSVSGVKPERQLPWGPPNNSLKRTDQSLRD